MNGLKYIRTRCNLSINELADFIGVTRQALSSWENGKKDIPVQRKEQLAKFFGIDKAYFGEISEKEKKYLLEKAMFRYNDNGKETYRYKPLESLTSLNGVSIYFLGDRDISLDEEYVLSQRKRQATLEKVDDIIKWTKDDSSIDSQVMCINRGCNIYGSINDLMEYMRGLKVFLRMPFYYEIKDVLKAMLLAYGLLEKEQLHFLDDSDYHCAEDGEWVIQLSEQIKEHWNTSRTFHEKYQEEVKKEMQRDAKEKKEEKEETKTVLSIDEQIKYFEEKNRQCAKEHPDALKIIFPQ